MPVRIYDISKKLGLENKEVLSKAKELGIAAARVASSSLDKITAEYLEDQLKLTHPKPAPLPPAPEPPPVVLPAPLATLPAPAAMEPALPATPPPPVSEVVPAPPAPGGAQVSAPDQAIHSSAPAPASAVVLEGPQPPPIPNLLPQAAEPVSPPSPVVVKPDSAVPALEEPSNTQLNQKGAPQKT